MTLPDRILTKRSIDPVAFLLSVMTRIAESETDANAYEDSVLAVDLCLFLLKPRTQRDISRMFRTAQLRHMYERTFVSNGLRSQVREEERDPDGV